MNSNKKILKKTLIIPIRIQGRTTSITLKKSIVILYMLFTVIPEGESINYSLNRAKRTQQLKGAVLDFVYKCLDQWNGKTAKGLSDFVTDKMILELLDEDDLEKYNKIVEIIADL